MVDAHPTSEAGSLSPIIPSPGETASRYPDSIWSIFSDTSIPGVTDTDRQVIFHLQDRMRSDNVLNLDIDHTIVERGSRLNPETRTFDPSQYMDTSGTSVELENIDIVLLNALHGTAVHIITGKDANIWPLATNMRQRLETLAEKLGMTNRYSDGRLKTKDGTRPVIVVFSVGNGGYSIDLLATEATGGGVIVQKPIPLGGWEGLQEAEQLLRDSTTHERKTTIASKPPHGMELANGSDTPKTASRLTPPHPYNETDDAYVQLKKEGNLPPPTNQAHLMYEQRLITTVDQLHREVEPNLTPIELAHRMALQASIRDFAVHTPLSTKVNLVLDVNRIVSDPDLNQRWEQRTGIKITNEQTLFQAFEKLAKDWPVNIARAFAGGVTFIDIFSHVIDKRISGRLIKLYVYGLCEVYAQQEQAHTSKPRWFTLSLGDQPEPGTNDAPMLHHTGGLTNAASVEVSTQNGKVWPFPLARIYGPLGNMDLTNKFLRDLVHAHATNAEEKAKIDELLHQLEERRRQKFTDKTLVQ